MKKNQPVNYSIFWRPIGFGLCGCFVVACFRHSPGERTCAWRQPKKRLRLSRWRSWVKRGNTGFRMSLASGVFSALSCLSGCLQDQKETVINIRFSQLWLAPNRWHFNVLQEITSNSHIHTCTLINTFFFPIWRHSEARYNSECQWKSFTPAVTHRSPHTHSQVWHSLIDRCFKLLLSWRILSDEKVTTQSHPFTGKMRVVGLSV